MREITTGTVWIGCEDGEDLHLAYTAYGRPTASMHLLLVHGLFDDRRTWEDLLSHLQQDDRYVVTVDLLGAGQSSRPRLLHLPPHERYGADLHVQHLQRLVSELNLRNLVLVGSSLGGGIVLRMLCVPWPDRPTLLGLILEGAAAYHQQTPLLMRQLAGSPGRLLSVDWIRTQANNLGLARRIVDRSIRRCFFDPGTVAQDLADRYLEILDSSKTIQAYRETVRNLVPSDMEEVVQKYSHIRLPTLVCWGQNDQVVSPLYGQRLVEDIAGAQLTYFENCGHAPHLERPAQMANVMDTWLSDLDRQ
jgi:2-hydroxymuconate-semialdehyde hydrolase